MSHSSNCQACNHTFRSPFRLTFKCPACGATATCEGATPPWEVASKSPEINPPKLRQPPNHWLQLHRDAFLHRDSWSPVTAEARFLAWQMEIPNIGCGCMDHWRKMVDDNPPVFTSPDEFFEWGWMMHNKVNQRINKPRPSLSEARALYQG
jgi:hypothetical protein